MLKAAGIQVAVISKVTATIQPSSVVGSEAHMAACLECVRKWEPDDLFAASYVTGESLLEAYAATLIEGDFRDKSPDLHEQPTVAEWTAQDSINALFGPMAHTGAMYVPAMTSWERQALESVCGRCFFTCENGYIGLGADGCNEGMSTGRTDLCSRTKIWRLFPATLKAIADTVSFKAMLSLSSWVAKTLLYSAHLPRISSSSSASVTYTA
jgi:hypothetical protein